jgi:gliding motility-associated-like protein
MRKLLVAALVCLGLYSKSQSTAICSGNTATLAAPNPSSLTGPSYSMNPGGFQSLSGNFVVSPTVTTNYTLYTTGTYTNGSTITTNAVQTVTVLPQPIANPSYTQVTCTSTVNAINLGVTFAPANPAPAYTVAWQPTSTGSPPNIPNGITSNQQFTTTGGIAPGPYQAIVTAAGGCSVTISFTINPQPAAALFTVFPAGNTQSITCLQPTLNLTVNGSTPAYTFTWSGNSLGVVTGTGVTLTSANQGSLVVSATNTLSGCSSTKTLTIGVNTVVPVSNLTPTAQTINCTLSAQLVTLTAVSPTVNFSHVVTPPQGGNWISNLQVANYFPAPGTSTYCLVDNANGCQTCKTFSVNSGNVFPIFSIQSSPQNFTIGCSTKSITTVSIPGATTQPIAGGAVSYTILPPGASTVLPNGPLLGSANFTINIPGTYTLVTRDNQSACDARIPVTILSNTVGPSIDTVIVPTNVLNCYTNSITVEAHSETQNVSYNWQAPGNLNYASSIMTVAISPTAAATATLNGTYTITVKENNNLCITTKTLNILKNTFPPNAKASTSSPSITCSSNSVILTNQSSTGIPPGVFPTNSLVVAFQWAGPSPEAGAFIATTYTGYTTGTYTLTAKDLNNGCTSTTTIPIFDGKIYNLVNTPTAPKTPSIDCGSATGTQSYIPIYSQPTVSSSYSWIVPPAAQGSTTSPLNQASVAVSVAGIYTVICTYTASGCVTSGTVEFQRGVLTGSVDVSTSFGYAPLNVKFFNNSYSSNDANNILTVWDFGNSSTLTANSVSVQPEAIYNFPGTYTATAYVTKRPCTATVKKVINVEVPPKLEVPNIFTPNGDNINDIFFLHTSNVTEITIKIFDRWGHKVYDLVSDKGNIAWDGKDQQGVECAAGVYFYVLKATGADGQTWDTKGNITLVR